MCSPDWEKGSWQILRNTFSHKILFSYLPPNCSNTYKNINDAIWQNGPNHLWDIDGYDKLKPFGFCIHGAIDGFSRRILWLDVGYTNNYPTVISQNYVDCACPATWRNCEGYKSWLLNWEWICRSGAKVYKARWWRWLGGGLQFHLWRISFSPTNRSLEKYTGKRLYQMMNRFF